MALTRPPSRFQRALPIVGSVLMFLGFTQLGVLLLHSGKGASTLQALFGCLALLGAGAGLIQRRTGTSPTLWLYVAVAALAATALVLWLITRPA